MSVALGSIPHKMANALAFHVLRLASRQSKVFKEKSPAGQYISSQDAIHASRRRRVRGTIRRSGTRNWTCSVSPVGSFGVQGLVVFYLSRNFL
jgi:hypothetical protein